MKTFKILFFIVIINTFLLSCSVDIIDDFDGDGESDTLNFVSDVYSLREDEYMQRNIREYSSELLSPNWFKPENPLYTTPFATDRDDQYIEKNDVRYTPLYKYIKGNKAEIYRIKSDKLTPANVGKFVFITLEPVPIFQKSMVILLISKNMYATLEEAQTAAELVDIPEIKMHISHLDLVFDNNTPESDYVSYENVEANVAAILANYNLLEFFGTTLSYEKKRKLLIDYGYDPLF